MKQVAASLTAEEIRDLVGDSPLMLEIGCHDGSKNGSHTLRFLEAMPGIRLHCFEPDSRPAERFRQLLGNDPRVTLYEVAITDSDGPTPFHASTGKAGSRSDYDLSGSVEKPTGHLKRSSGIRFKPPVPVPGVRLDMWIQAHPEIEKIDFMWVDIQGAQVKFLAGAQHALAITRYLYIECHKKPMYENEPSQDELIAMLPGFTPLAIFGAENILFKNESQQKKERDA